MAVCHLSYKKKVCAHLLFFVILQNVIFTKESTALLLKLSRIGRYERSHRPIRALTSVEVSVHIGRSKTTLLPHAHHFITKTCRFLLMSNDN